MPPPNDTPPPLTARFADLVKEITNIAAQFISPYILRMKWQERVATMREAAKIIEIWTLIEDLRKEPGSAVLLLCDNDDPPPVVAIEVGGEWNGYAEQRFEGDSLLMCLQTAVAVKRAAEKQQQTTA
jgi:hypothetical protein